MIHKPIRFLILTVLLPILALTLTACYTITLKEKRVEGMGSAISIKLPGNLQSFDVPIPVAPAAKPYYEGSRLYGENDAGLYIAVYTNRVDVRNMADDLQLKESEAIRQNLNGTVETTSKAVLAQLGVSDVSISRKDTTFQGLPAVSQNLTFTYEKKSMQGRLLGFSDGPVTWIVVVACDGSKEDKVKLADQVMDSITLQP
ncbi:hypothetical protein [uncultured Megasphaera sp.]|uniref:hypothetical protein n=1 Tax=uncultured Megasphaera sp. TaxID=165188 RepID=UPI0025E8045F|nr:hypothetical protein [uncultured Megasphaera sp.]